MKVNKSLKLRYRESKHQSVEKQRRYELLAATSQLSPSAFNLFFCSLLECFLGYPLEWFCSLPWMFFGVVPLSVFLFSPWMLLGCHGMEWYICYPFAVSCLTRRYLLAFTFLVSFPLALLHYSWYYALGLALPQVILPIPSSSLWFHNHRVV